MQVLKLFGNEAKITGKVSIENLSKLAEIAEVQYILPESEIKNRSSFADPGTKTGGNLIERSWPPLKFGGTSSQRV